MSCRPTRKRTKQQTPQHRRLAFGIRGRIEEAALTVGRFFRRLTSSVRNAVRTLDRPAGEYSRLHFSSNDTKPRGPDEPRILSTTASCSPRRLPFTSSSLTMALNIAQPAAWGFERTCFATATTPSHDPHGAPARSNCLGAHPE